MITTRCSHRGCDKTFSHPTQKKADAALRMHVGRMHKKHITCLGESDLQPKRRYVRKKKEEHHHGGANYCPQCGFNLAMLAVAMQVAGKVK